MNRSHSRSSSMTSERSGRSKRHYEPPQPNNQIYVSPLPADITDHDLHEIFGPFGRIHKVNIVRKEDGYTFGFVAFENVEQAMKAVERANGQKIDGKLLKVRYTFPRSKDKEGMKGRDSSYRGRFENNRRPKYIEGKEQKTYFSRQKRGSLDNKIAEQMSQRSRDKYRGPKDTHTQESVPRGDKIPAGKKMDQGKPPQATGKQDAISQGQY